MKQMVSGETDPVHLTGALLFKSCLSVIRFNASQDAGMYVILRYFKTLRSYRTPASPCPPVSILMSSSGKGNNH